MSNKVTKGEMEGCLRLPLTVVYNWAYETLSGLSPETPVAEIRGYMRHVLGIPDDALPWLDGDKTKETDPVGHATTLEFKVADGEKGWAWSEDELVQKYPQISEAIVRERLAKYAESHPSASFLGNGEVWYMDNIELRRFLAQEFGPPHELSAPIATVPPRRVTLLQMATILQISKRTLEKNKRLPLPDIDGGGGKAGYWMWDRIRPWLEKEYRMGLPEYFPDFYIPARPPRNAADDDVDTPDDQE